MAKITDAERVKGVHMGRRRHIRAQTAMGVSQRELRRRLGLPLLTISAVIHSTDQPEEVRDQEQLEGQISDWHGVIFPGVGGNVVPYGRRGK